MNEYVDLKPHARLAGLWRKGFEQPISASRIRRLILGAAAVASILATIYWTAIASNRYVSEAQVMVQRTDLPGVAPSDLGSLLSGITNGGNRPDQMQLRSYLMSVDMLRKLDAELNLRRHYSDWHRDPLSRLLFADTPMEKFHNYYLKRVTVDYDDYGGGLIVKAQAFDPKMAQAIVKVMVREGERFLNQTDHSLARAQVDFLDDEVERMNERNIDARKKVLDYQDREGLLSPESTAMSIQGIIAQLESRRAVLQTQLSALEAYLVPDHPNVVTIRQEIDAIEKQIATEQEKLASRDGDPLNRQAEEFQRLQADATFTQQVYQTTLAALEKGRIDAMRTVKKITITQSPTLPEISTRPRRLYNSLVFALAAFLLAGIALLLSAIVRDHID